MAAIIIDTSVLLLLIVGKADKSYISMHKRLQEFSQGDFELLDELVRPYELIVTLPNVLTEVSSLGRQLRDPARSQFQRTFRQFIHLASEVYVGSVLASSRVEFIKLGLTDACILSACEKADGELALISTDEGLLNAASALGYDVVDFREYMSG